MPLLILSSSSTSRKELLSRLRIPFQSISPDIDETPALNETVEALVKRLAISKAKVHEARFPDALIIGCDQVAQINNRIVGKPKDHEEAVTILLEASGQKITFYTGLCLYNSGTGQIHYSLENYTVRYRDLTRAMIEDYLAAEQPYHCAGSIEIDGLGIALIAELHGSDPTALTGLPLIKLIEMLKAEHVDVLKLANALK